MRRGDEIVAIDGVSVASLISSGQLNSAFGPDEKGYTVEFEIIHVGETDPVTLSVSKDEVTLTIVGANHTDFSVGGESVGYLYFRSFVNPAFNQLDQAFGGFKDAGITKLILDLRYNGGGLLSVTEHLGSLLVGTTLEDTVLAEIEFNDRYTHLNVRHRIQELANSIGITDLVVITTGSTASASEMVINGLAPHINVVTVGDNTHGKPVGQSRLTFCETQILRAVTFKVVNSQGQGEYFPPVGIAPTCSAVDDITRQLGEADEASVAEALYYLENQSCSGAQAKAARQLAHEKALWPTGDPLVRDGKDVLRGGVR
jgi:C-terminal processing protease CtpA/Prc